MPRDSTSSNRFCWTAFLSKLCYKQIAAQLFTGILVLSWSNDSELVERS